jgi:hypothetical protein
MATWGAFAAAVPDLAAFGAALFGVRPSYLATADAEGWPRVHPVTPIVGRDDLFLFMEPTSPKGRDLEQRRTYALHNGVPDNAGSGGEFWVRGTAERAEDPAVRALAASAAAYEPADRYVLFRLTVDEARAGGYGDIALPTTTRWRDATRD